MLDNPTYPVRLNDFEFPKQETRIGRAAQIKSTLGCRMQNRNLTIITSQLERLVNGPARESRRWASRASICDDGRASLASDPGIGGDRISTLSPLCDHLQSVTTCLDGCSRHLAGPEGAQDAAGGGESQRPVVLRVRHDGRGPQLCQPRQQQPVHPEVLRRPPHVHGQELLVPHHLREHDDAQEPLVSAEELHQQVRAGLHRNRRAHQAVRVHGLLREVALQRWQHWRLLGHHPPRGAARPRSPGPGPRRFRLLTNNRGLPLTPLLA
ncbi:hypothetical protein C0J52_04932 [Blattella germanica]|nr:hypothetical protein C0J52_04932 [Blattella germanica]